MQVRRCPECGIRLDGNYCDICLRRVPVRLAPEKQTWQWENGSSAHREEKHDCIDFEIPEAQPAPAAPYRKQPSLRAAKTGILLLVGFLMVMSVVTSLFGFVKKIVTPESDTWSQEETVAPDILGAELYDANGIRVTADSAGLAYGEYTVYLTLENQTDESVYVDIDQVSANGYMMLCGISTELAAGEQTQTYLTLYEYDLEQAGILQVANVECVLKVYGMENWEEIVPGALLALELEPGYEQAVDEDGMELFCSGGVSLRLRGGMVDSFGEAELELSLENSSGSTVDVYLGQTMLNGQQVGGALWSTLRPGTRAVTNAYLYELEEWDITGWEQIEQITLEICVDYMDGLDVAETVCETITFNPNEI